MVDWDPEMGDFDHMEKVYVVDGFTVTIWATWAVTSGAATVIESCWLPPWAGALAVDFSAKLKSY